MKPNRFRDLRVVRAASAALLVAGALAACGGGSSIGINVPGPVACLSTQSGGIGFALGFCQGTATGVFQPVSAAVRITPGVVAFPSQDGYTLELVFPAALQAQQPLDDVIPFTQLNQPVQDIRSVAGALRGQWYEDPLNADPVPPYVALGDFHRAWNRLDDPATAKPTLALGHAGFGLWQKYPQASFGEHYLGAWFAPRGATNNANWPAGPVARLYRGVVVGMVAPDGSAGAALTEPRRFSAPIEIEVDGTGRIVAGQIGTMTTSVTSGSGVVVTSTLPFGPIALSLADGVLNGTLDGALSTAVSGTTNSVAGDYEAGYFAPDGQNGAEMAGRMRFTSGSGLIGIGAFGAAFVP
ncbi:MAG: hypothetical protein KJ011_16790 [Burkholderiaceae bacterium]|nr:hypothetical protein [Burkholderiaceae bacterium]